MEQTTSQKLYDLSRSIQVCAQFIEDSARNGDPLANHNIKIDAKGIERYAKEILEALK